jgi:hypothetical protein
VWSEAKYGWYASGTSNRYVLRCYKDGSGDYTEKSVYAQPSVNQFFPSSIIDKNGNEVLAMKLKTITKSVSITQGDGSVTEDITGFGFDPNSLITVAIRMDDTDGLHTYELYPHEYGSVFLRSWEFITDGVRLNLHEFIGSDREITHIHVTAGFSG